MKRVRLMTLMVGLAFLTTTVAVSFGQETTTKKAKKGHKKAPKTDTTKQ